VKKQMLKKVYAMVLAITLIGSQQCSSVLANDIAQIYSGVTQNTEIPDYDYWMAQTIMNGIDNNGNSLYSTFRSFSEPVYRQLGEYLLDDKPLVSISTAWSIYFNSEYRNQLTNMQKYVYEMLLMDYLKYDAFGEDKNKELTNSKTDFALKIYDAIGEELNDKKESYINNLPVKESKEICRRIETIYGLGEVLKGVNEGIKTTKELIDCMSEYLAVLKVKDDCVSLLKVMQEQVSVDGDFKKAISEVLNTIDGTPIDYESKKYGEYLWNKILDAGWSALEDSNPVLGALNWGMNGLDVCFNSQDRASNNLKLALLYTTDCYMQQGMFAAADSFRRDPNSENGKKFTYCFNAYIRFQMYANNYATTWLNNYLNGGAASDIINWIYHKENVSTATELINICKRQNKYRQSLINNQLKYADIYFAKYKIADEEIIPTARRNSITVDKGKTKQFVIDNVLSGAKVVYSSSNNKVAYVNSKGVIKGVKSGTATITAKVVQNKKTYYVNLAVKVCDPQKDWYKKVLNSKSGTYYVKYYDGYQGTQMDKKKVKRSDFTYYKLIDLNNDGVKELLLATDRSVLWDNRVLLLTYYNGKVLPLICFEGAGARGRQLINKKTLILANSGSDFSSQIYLSVVKGKLKILQQTYRQNMKKGYPPQYLYKVNNKKVSESIYQKAIDKYGLSIAKQIEFKRVW